MMMEKIIEKSEETISCYMQDVLEIDWVYLKNMLIKYDVYITGSFITKIFFPHLYQISHHQIDLYTKSSLDTLHRMMLEYFSCSFVTCDLITLSGSKYETRIYKKEAFTITFFYPIVKKEIDQFIADRYLLSIEKYAYDGKKFCFFNESYPSRSSPTLNNFYISHQTLEKHITLSPCEISSTKKKIENYEKHKMQCTNSFTLL